MKIIWKGKYSNVQQLSVGTLPGNAVRLREPSSFLMLNLIALIFVIPVLIFIGVVFYIKMRSGLIANFRDMASVIGTLAAFLMVIPHEFLHAAAFPKHAEVEIWYSPKNMAAFAVSTYPLSKLRFVFVSFLPNIIFGFVPLIAWIFIPVEFLQVSRAIFTFASLSLLVGVGDFLNVFNALIQMPRNSIIQTSGFHSYWYLK